MSNIAPSYSEQQVLLCTIDVLENPDMQQYAMGGYPTVRVFFQGKTTKNSFLGAKNEEFVRNFVDTVINNTSQQRQVFRELQNSKEFNEFIAKAEVPVFVKFSAFT